MFKFLKDEHGFTNLIISVAILSIVTDLVLRATKFVYTCVIEHAIGSTAFHILKL